MSSFSSLRSKKIILVGYALMVVNAIVFSTCTSSTDAARVFQDPLTAAHRQLQLETSESPEGPGEVQPPENGETQPEEGGNENEPASPEPSPEPAGQGSDQGANQGSGQGADQGSGQGSDQGSGQGADQGSGQGSDQGSGDGTSATNSSSTPEGWNVASATFYGNADGYKLEDGTCSCQKAKDSGKCYNDNCFDSLGDDRLVAAINTPGMENTRKCGQCVELRCVPGKNRGRSDSKHDTEDVCLSKDKTITVAITDSCPEDHENNSNQGNCKMSEGTHFDLSFWAFELLAPTEKGVIDLEYQFVQCPGSGATFSNCCEDGRQCVTDGDY